MNEKRKVILANIGSLEKTADHKQNTVQKIKLVLSTVWFLKLYSHSFNTVAESDKALLQKLKINMAIGLKPHLNNTSTSFQNQWQTMLQSKIKYSNMIQSCTGSKIRKHFTQLGNTITYSSQKISQTFWLVSEIHITKLRRTN